MRFWLFHPAAFYPIVLVLAVLVVGLSLKPQMIPRHPAAVAGERDGPTILLQREAFNAPTDPPQEHVTVVRNFWGQPQSLRIAALPGVGPPTNRERGVEILLTPATARMLSNRHLLVEVTYQPLAVNAAPMLAVAAINANPVRWMRRTIPPLSGIVQYELPPTPDMQSIGLRPIHSDGTMAFGVEIISVRVWPRAN
jgi:hypothetical protein